MKDNRVLVLSGENHADQLSLETIKSFLENDGTDLKHLTLSHSDVVTEETIAAIAQYCPNLETLTLQHCSALKIVDFTALSSLKNFKLEACDAVELWKYQEETVTKKDHPEIFIVIMEIVNHSTTETRASKKKINPQQARLLAQAIKLNNTITDINLSWGNIGTDGAKYIAEALKNNSNITGINLSSNNIGKDGAKHIAEALKNNKSITNINLFHNNLGKDGAKYIAETLKNNNTITDINLSWGNIGTDGAKDLAEALKNNKTITNINLMYNDIGKDGAKYITEALKNNNTITDINIYDNKIGSASIHFDEIRTYLERNERLVKGKRISPDMARLYIRRMRTKEEQLSNKENQEGQFLRTRIITQEIALLIADYIITDKMETKANIIVLEKELKELQAIMDKRIKPYKTVFNEQLEKHIIIPAFQRAQREEDSELVAVITKAIHSKPELKIKIGQNIERARERVTTHLATQLEQDGSKFTFDVDRL